MTSPSLRRRPPMLLKLHPLQIKIALDVARGMDYLHQCNIVHRDLKSANLLLSEHGDVKVADFGLSRMVDGVTATMTAETGTYRWMAPEVVLHEPYDGKCDVFSFGVVLWEVASGGKVPYGKVPTLRVAIGVAKVRSSTARRVTALSTVIRVRFWLQWRWSHPQ